MCEPKVSVIIPIYNSEQYLEECLDSVLAQTLQEIEIICVNDGSTDDSPKILKRYAAVDSRIRILEQKNAGQSCARNKGVSSAKGAYISFVDSDDFIAPEMLESLYERGKATESDIVICDLWLYENSTKEKTYYRDQALYLYLKNKVFTLEEQPEMINKIGVWDRIYKRSLLQNNHIEFPQGLIYEDHLYCIQTALLATRISLVPKPFYYYRKNAGDSITDREAKETKHKQDFLEINQRIQTLFREAGISRALREEYLSYFMFNAVMHQQNIASHTFFASFFNGIRALLTDKDYEAIEKMEYMPAVRYGIWLKSGNCSACRRYFSLRRYFKHQDSHIYFAPPGSKKKIKIK